MKNGGGLMDPSAQLTPEQVKSECDKLNMRAPVKSAIEISAGGDDRSLWRLMDLGGVENAKAQLREWGAQDVYDAGASGSGYNTFFARVGCKWYYAHTDGRSVYCATETAFDGPTGMHASFQHKLRNARSTAENLRASLLKTEAEIAELMRIIEDPNLPAKYPAKAS